MGGDDGSERWVEVTGIPRAMSHDGTQDRHLFRLPTGTLVTLFHVKHGATGASQLYCMDALCHHQAGELGRDGVVDVEDAWGPDGRGPRVQCPAHGRTFRLRTGAEEVGGGGAGGNCVPRAQRVYKVRVRRDGEDNVISVRYRDGADSESCLSDTYSARDAARAARGPEAKPGARGKKEQQGLLTDYYRVTTTTVGKRTSRLAEATEAVLLKGGRRPPSTTEGAAAAAAAAPPEPATLP